MLPMWTDPEREVDPHWRYLLNEWERLTQVCRDACRGRYDLVDDLMCDVCVARMESIFNAYDASRGSLWGHVKRSVKWYAYKYMNSVGRERFSAPPHVGMHLIEELGWEPSYTVDLDSHAWVSSILESLCDEHKKILVMRVVLGLHFIEIGEVLGCGKTTARTRYQEALAEARRVAGEE